jgi:GTP pyrophosphokinase
MKHREASLELIEQKVKVYFPEADTSLFQKAWKFADDAHRGQMRASGDPYIIHPLDVAMTLAEMRLDPTSILAGLLHDTVEDTSVTLEDIAREFGADTAQLVDGVTKLSKISFKNSEEKQAENFRKMILAMSRDIRVILVKLADRISNLRTLEFLPEHKQKIIAQESLDIYAPIANRLGIGWMKSEIEDWCLRYLHPEIYYKLAEKVSKSKKERERYIEEITQMIQDKMAEYDIVGNISGRAKNFYSIYKKMDRRQVDFDQVNDLIAFRILVDNITECYKALGVMHATYKPVPGRFKDYIAMPKANQYQSLHTTVIGFTGERIEIQIRTHEMHSTAERGIAAHWRYKEGRFESKNGDNVEWVNRLMEWQRDLKDPTEFLETVKIDLFAEDVFVFTPRGDVKQLPHHSTPIDFAYAVHTNVGHRCVGAKLNGKIISLKHRLKSGDTIDIITSPNQTPSKDWLKIAKSSRARTKIRAFIKQQERDRALSLGTDLLEKALKPFDLSVSKLEKQFEKQGSASVVSKVLQEANYKTIEELCVAISYGRLTTEWVVARVVPKEELEKRLQEQGKTEDSFLKKIFKAAARKSEARNAITVANIDDVLIRFGKCCNPVPGDNIVGFITRGRGVTVHRVNCQVAIGADAERRVDVKWNITNKSAVKRNVRVRIFAQDEPGLLAAMSQSVTAQGANIRSANVRTTKDKKAVAIFEVEVTDTEQLDRIIRQIEAKRGVISVERTGDLKDVPS